MNLKKLMENNLRVLLVSPPGMGKTARISAIANAIGRKVVVMRASLSERVDFGGALVPDMKAGITKALPLELLANLQVTKEPTLLFLDDLGQAPIDVQSALMRLFDGGSLSNEVLLWGATNRPGDKAGVTALCEPLRSRFDLAFAIASQQTDEEPTGATYIGTWKEEVDNWIDWAISVNAAPEIIAWHRASTGRTLYQWKPCADPAVRMPDFRSWETTIKLWNSGIRDMRSIGAAIGKPAAAEFIAFSSLAAKLATPDQVRTNPLDATIPTDASSLYLTVSMLCMASTPKDIKPFSIYASRLSEIYAALFYRDLFKRHGTKLSGEPEWIKWSNDHQQLFIS